jgi:hypothetical protein
LQSQNENEDERGVGISAEKLSNFWMRFHNGARPLRMGLIEFRGEKILLHDWEFTTGELRKPAR